MTNFATSRELSTSQSLKYGWSHQTVRITKKLLGSVARFASSVIAYYPRSTPITRENMENHRETGILDLPDEILLQILVNCDFPSTMSMRAVNWRLHALVEESAKYLAKGDLVGGVEISCGVETSGSHGTEDEATALTEKLVLTRPNHEIHLPAYRLSNLFRHVRVWHSLRLSRISLDEEMTGDLLEASFGGVSDLTIDEVHSVTSETLSLLVTKANPSQRLIFSNDDSAEFQTAITSAVFDNCTATHIKIQSHLEHQFIDDEALAKLILCDLTVRREIRLSPSAITHNGILSAAMQFFNYCNEIMSDFTEEMELPVWEITVILPPSPLIDLNQLIPPPELLPHCFIVSQQAPSRAFFKITVETMFLHIIIV